MNIGETDELSAWHARKLIRWCLAESESMELAGLVKQTAMDERLIRREIMRLMSEGVVSLAQTLSLSSGSGHAADLERRRFRWNQASHAL